MVERPSDEPSEPDKRPKEQPPELITQADLVIQEFKRLADEYDFASPADTPVDISIEGLRSKKDLLTRLDSSLLPQLQHQCASLSGLLREPNHLQNNPASTLKLISEMQANIHLTLRQMTQTLNEIFPGKIPDPYQTNDQRFNELKIYRLHSFENSLRNTINSRLGFLFLDSIRIIENFKLSTAWRSNSVELAYLLLDEKIELAINYLKGSELQLIWDLWSRGIGKVNNGLKALLWVTNPNESDLSQPAIKLGRSILPIFKLSRLFFKKLYQQNIQKKDVGLFTDMCSNQLVSLHVSIDDIQESISNMCMSITDADQPIPGNTGPAIFQEINKLIDLFQSHLSFIYLYVLPNVFPNPIDFSHQIYFQNWFLMWTTSFHLATHNAIQATRSFSDRI
ncbi:hypothetical protein PGT21_017028 [Puccinia graminis f. sp. tritici]|uniref:Uncharacterized protein n=1 Tax=Puccinia graminis f. sp. tritici TaxID=56615 RepID=A0A5B0RN84_PUCGR|nr:hypothetical protein PGT21_017028 [Puccinia graminis f. sp. tritici]KAA1126899.1 hypothetical protein PGTUg99_030643 [Puccinia graminis f. sp. tritici]